MASLPIDPTFARQAPYTPKSNIRVVFLPGPAQTAMAGELAKLPAEVPEATLEELEVAALARDVITLAKTRLSAAIYPAFLRWADAAFYTHVADDVGDDEGQRRNVAAYEARDALNAIPAVSPSDYTLKTHLVEITGQQEILTPLGDEGHFNWSGDNVGLIKKLDGLVAKAFEYSDHSRWLSVPICDAVCQVFRNALTAQDAAPLSSNDGLPLRPLLIERNALIERLREGEDLDEAAMNAACVELNRLDTIITSSPANTADDAVVKLLTLAQISAEGHEVDDGESIQAIIEARKHFGVGYVDVSSSQPKSPVPITLPQGYDPFMRGPFIQWQRAYERYAAARVERTLYEKGEFAVASAQYEASVQDADAEIAFEAKQSRFDQLANAEYEALQALIRCVAPAPSELATKLKLFHDNRMWLDNAPGDLLAVIAADARRFGGHGAHVESDKLLLDTFAKLRAETQCYLDCGSTGDEEDDATSDRIDALEDVFFDQRANTIEGVIAKLRETFRHLNGDAWADHATVDPEHPEFQAGIRLADRFSQAIWYSVEDLARIGGVSLTEVRA